jgi:hypothetical protein
MAGEGRKERAAFFPLMRADCRVAAKRERRGWARVDGWDTDEFFLCFSGPLFLVHLDFNIVVPTTAIVY